jgi:hypothetical protein
MSARFAAPAPAGSRWHAFALRCMPALPLIIALAYAAAFLSIAALAWRLF